MDAFYKPQLLFGIYLAGTGNSGMKNLSLTESPRVCPDRNYCSVDYCIVIAILISWSIC